MLSVRDRLLSHIAQLARKGLPYSAESVAALFGCEVSSIRTYFKQLVTDGAVSVETRAIGTRWGRCHRVTIIATGAVTAWPEGSFEVATAASRDDELREARQAAEDERQRHERYWLARERTPRRREQPRDHFFIDKETARALNGGYA